MCYTDAPEQLSSLSHWKERKAANHRDWDRFERSMVVPSHKYANELIRLACGPDLLALKIFPDAKEVAESFAAYAAVKKRLPTFDMTDPEVVLLAVGDGCQPRTAATFAFRTQWECHSIDPQLREPSKLIAGVNRLTLHASKVEAVRITSARRAVIAAVHSHAHFFAALDAVPNAEEVGVVVLPCCEPLALPPGGFDAAYDDDGIPSPERTVYVFGPKRVAALRAWRARDS
jgi:hypothetical protein